LDKIKRALFMTIIDLIVLAVGWFLVSFILNTLRTQIGLMPTVVVAVAVPTLLLFFRALIAEIKKPGQKEKPKA